MKRTKPTNKKFAATLVSLTLLTTALVACSPTLDQNDADIHGQSAGRDAVGITEPDSTQDKITHDPSQVQQGAEVDLNDQVEISSNTTPVGNEQTYQEVITDRTGTQVTRQGEIAGQNGMSDTTTAVAPMNSTNTTDMTFKTPDTQVLSALSAPELSTLRDLLTAADMEGLLAQGQHTLLAPSNLAFSQLPAEQLNQLKQDKSLLQQVLLRHVLLKPMTAQNLNAATAPATMLGGQPLEMQQARVLRPDLQAGVSYIHVIDKVLLPTNLTQS